MALDTVLKRSSALNVSSPWRGILPRADGELSAADRQVVAFMYGGILSAVTTSPIGPAITVTMAQTDGEILVLQVQADL